MFIYKAQFYFAHMTVCTLYLLYKKIVILSIKILTIRRSAGVVEFNFTFLADILIEGNATQVYAKVV